jgi:hypothetical protein
MKQYLLGTAVKITSIINVNTVTTVTITIEDPSNSEKVSGATMTNDANQVYTYIWQSAVTDEAGTYVARITLTEAGYTSVKEYNFEMIGQSDQ